MLEPQWIVPASVVRVIDGDTIKMTLDLGWRIYLNANCRITGLNAPELRTPPGERSKAHAETLLPVGKRVLFVSHSLDKYGRPLGAIRYGDGDFRRDFADDMIEAGHAIRYYGG